MTHQNQSEQHLIDQRRQRIAELEDASQQAETDATLVAALQASEERFRKVFEEGPLGVVLLGLDGRIQHCNRRFCEMLGYSEEDIIALGLIGISHQEDWQKDRQFGSRLLRGEIPNYTIDKRYVRKGGAVFWGQLTVSMMHDAEGKPTTVIGMVEDISERKRAEAELRSSERTLRTLIDASLETIALVDTEGTVLVANETMAYRLGRTVDEITGHIVYDFLPAEVAANRREHVSEAIRTGKPVRFEDKRLDRYFETVVCPILDDSGGVVTLAALGIDRTAQKRAEAALKEAHEELERRVEQRTAELAKTNKDLVLFRKVAEASGQAFSIVNLSGEIIYVNQTMCRLLGENSPDDVVGKHLSAYHSAAYVHMRQEEFVPLLLRQRHWQGETVITLGADSHSLVQDSHLVCDEQGNPAYVATVMADISQRKRAEESLRQAQEQLQREHRTLKHLLQSSDHERQTIAYEIHDGLAQQLAGAIMQFQTFNHLKEIKPKEALKAYDAGMTMLQQGHRECRRLISGVRPPILDEEGIVAAVAHLVHEQNRLKGPKIEYHSNVHFDRLAPIVENAIYRIVQEGLTNVYRHSKSKKARVSLLQREDRVQIEIRDWGIGFDKRSIPENCFGLEGIRQRVRLLGGKCSVRTTAGKGTRTILELPVVKE